VRIHFYIRYYSKPGESLAITGNIPVLGNNDPLNSFALTWFNSELWSGEIEVDPSVVGKISYSYVFISADGDQVYEGGQPRTIDVSKAGIESIEVTDIWNYAGEFENVFYTDPFQKVLFRDKLSSSRPRSAKNFTHLFKVKAPLIRKNEVVFISGNANAVGGWDENELCFLGQDKDWWTIRLNLQNETFPLEYKYGIYNTKSKSVVLYENGENRRLHIDLNQKTLHIVHDGFVRTVNNSWKGAGVSLPVFSLRSESSFGVGEFSDLKLFSDWAKKCGIKLIQLLPVNDTTSTNTWKDSYPYASISAFALHPLYLNIDEVAGRQDHYIVKSFRKKQKQLNELADMDYEQVIKFKLLAARDLFQAQREKFMEEEEFKKFFEENKHWLIPYAAFCYLRDRNGTADFTKWKLYSRFDREAIEKYVSPKAKHYESIAFSYFLQYHLHLQLKNAVDYAHGNGVIIKGDIPIGVNRNGCDAWMDPDLFDMEQQAGAPPDHFAVKGQNWEFPVYRWDKMAEDHFGWWQRRFEQMGRYFDAFRIDHILGFFRIWTIPIDAVQGIMGVFNPALPIHVFEFAQRGMWFNYHRFCKPYITDAVLWELFGPNKDKFMPFLISTGNNNYILKDEFQTQRQVKQYFDTLEQTDDNNHILTGLYELISNVLLFEKPGSNGQEFHFRISMESTTTFTHLDWNMQNQMRDLYYDYFYHRQDEFWRKEAMKKLPSLKRATNMLICGEDLGMVPHGVPQVMKSLGILSLEIQRMPKDVNRQFFHPNDAPYLSVVTPSTHDMSTVRSWWEENREATQKFYNNELGQWGTAPEHCEAWISKAIFLQHLYSPAMWSIFQLQDIFGIDESVRSANYNAERINNPAISSYYWRYRMHITLEELLKEKTFNEEIRKYVEESGR
jgi:4-alpha-glucanotransferase